MNEGREKIIIRTSLVGIAANLMLAAFKAAAGIAANSIAVVLDAVNNLSDALSAVITILGARLAGKRPHREHPMGHGRIEYISALMVSAIVLYAGVAAFVESLRKIAEPVIPDYSLISLIVIAAAVATKVVLGRYVRRKGEEADSGALIASGTDAMADAVLSLAVFLSALFFRFTGISLEAYVGVVIAVFIMKAGCGMIQNTVKDIIGRRPDPQLCARIKSILIEEPEVKGAYDLFLHNYGPDKYYGSVHLEVPDIMTAAALDELSRRLEERIHEETGVILTAVGFYSYNTSNDKAAEIREEIRDVILRHEWALQMHGFYYNEAEKKIRFDVVMSFDIRQNEGCDILMRELSGLYPDYDIQMTPDIDIAD